MEWRETAGPHEHELWLRDRGTTERLLTFARHVDVLWSPDSAAIAITDYVGSDSADVWVIGLRDPRQRASVEEAFNRAFGRPPEVYRNGHRYFVARGWASPSALSFTIRAYDAEPGHEYKATFRYNLDGSVQKVQPR